MDAFESENCQDKRGRPLQKDKAFWGGKTAGIILVLAVIGINGLDLGVSQGPEKTRDWSTKLEYSTSYLGKLQRITNKLPTSL